MTCHPRATLPALLGAALAILVLACGAPAARPGVAAVVTGSASPSSPPSAVDASPAVTEDDVLRQRVTPRWLADGRLWYRHEQPDGKTELVLVDPATGDRAPAFDPARLSAALATANGLTIPPDELPVRSMDLDAQGRVLRFSAGGRRFRCDLRTYVIEELSSESRIPVELLHGGDPGPTEHTGAAAALSVVNRTAGPVVVYWMDFEGRRVKYAEIAPGGHAGQHTYAGHVWVLTDGGEGVYAAFETPEGGGEIVLDATTKPTLVPNAAPYAAVRAPDGRRVAFVRDHNVYVRDTRGGASFALSHDGSADDAYAEEDIYWSPDATHLVAVRTKKGDDRKVYLVESSPADQLQPKLSSYEYLKPGDRIPVSRPQLFDVAARARVAVDDRLFAQPWSVSEIRWSADSRRFTFLYNQRGHQILRVVAVDARNGEASAVVEERSRTFIDYQGKLFYQPLDDSHEIVWMSERDGYNHLYLYDAVTGLVKNQITRGAWVVRRVLRVDEKRRRIWLLAGGVRPGQDPYYLHLCRVDLDGSGFTVLTEGDGTHTVDLSPDERFFVDTWSRVDQPPVTELRRATDGTRVRELDRADASALQASGWVPPERFAAKGRDGSTDIYGIILRPRRFDPARRYPILEDIYAGPTGAFVPKAFGIAEGQRELCERGFIVVQIDGMGTSFRSRAFQEVAWKNLADAGFPDRIAWIKAAAARHPEMDLSRVGIYGGSAGGQNAMRALLSHGDFYKAAVADSGCHDNRMDKIWWNELWMGWPVDESYARSSNVVDAHRLQGKLMLVVGELDHNVDPSSTMQVVHALIAADKDFDLLVVPGGGHGAGDTPYGRRRRAEFFTRHLLGGGDPQVHAHGSDPRASGGFAPALRP